jgi:hypothetical protein
MNVTFYTDTYKFNHGKEPKGLGRWCFRLMGTEYEIWQVGKYSEVKKSVARQAKAAGFYRIEVLP